MFSFGKKKAPAEIKAPAFAAAPGSKNKLVISLVPSEEVHLNEEAPNSFSVSSTGVTVATESGDIQAGKDIEIEFTSNGEEKAELTVALNLYICTELSCAKKAGAVKLEITKGTEENVTKSVQYNLVA